MDAGTPARAARSPKRAIAWHRRDADLTGMLLSAPSHDLVRACAALLPADGRSRCAEDLAMDLRGRGWTVDTGHLTSVLTYADRLFVRTNDSFALLPQGQEPAAGPAITRADVHARLTRKLRASWWRLLAVQAAYPPLMETPTAPLARLLEADRRTRTLRVAKVHDKRHLWLLAWVDNVSVPRRESMPAWSCWRVSQLPFWEPGMNPVQPRYEGVPASELVVVHAARDAVTMADVLLRAMESTKARPQDLWIEPVPADGAEVDARTSLLAERGRSLLPTGAGRHAGTARCRWCAEPMHAPEDVARGSDAACWAVHEPAESEVLRFVRPEWVGALDRQRWAELVADPPRGGAPGLSRGRVAGAGQPV